MLFIKTAILSAMAALASAYTQPDYNQAPSGNAITKPGLNDMVTAGKPYTIEWEPSTEGPVSLVLLRGPSSNVKPIDTLAESIDNCGYFDWTPSKELEPDTTHYGLMLVVEGSGQYQYSTQFGVKNEEHGAVSSSAAASSSAPATTETPVSKGDGLHTIYSTEEFVTTKCPKCSAEASATSAAPATTLSSIPVSACTSSTAISSSASVTPSSSVAAATSTKESPSGAAAVTGTGTGSDSGSASSSASSSAPTSEFTGAANRNAVGLGAVAAGMLAVFAF